MAEDGNVAVELKTAATDQEPTSTDQDVIELKKTSELIVDQNDSRATNPDGAQSPASSTYADCEETDLLNSSTLDDVLTNDNENVMNGSSQEVVNNNHDSNLSPVHFEKDDSNDIHTVHAEPNEILQNGSADESKIEKDEPEILEKEVDVKENEDYEDVDSEEYEIEGASADDFKSHDIQDENDRENGDGEEVNQEEAIQKKLDDDEDRRNPQYIPKRGFFYEHDDRTAGTGSEEEAEEATKEAPAPEPESKRKGGRSIPDGRWQHDLYKEDEQHSKSAQELIDMYGYDIRNEESAPKARRRRKYGRGPNRYTRKWDDEDAYGKQTSKSFRTARRQKPLPVKREEYDAEFPSLDRKSHRPEAPPRERRKSPTTPFKAIRNQDTAKSEYNEERRRTPPRKSYPERGDRSSRSFSKRIPNIDAPAPTKDYNQEIEPIDPKSNTKQLRAKYIVTNPTTIGPRGRGIMGHGKPPRYANNAHEYEPAASRATQEPRMQFVPVNRGRSKRLDRPSSAQNYIVGKSVNDDELRELNEQMALVDLRSRRSTATKGDADRRPPNEQLQDQSTSVGSTLRSKRYSYQRQRLLPDSSNEKSVVDTNLHSVSSVQSIVGHSIANVVPQTVTVSVDNNGLHQVAAAKSVPLIPQSKLTSAPPSDTPSLSVNATSIPSNSLAVSASLIPLSAPPMTASGTALQPGAPPLPIMGFFQHPQGFTNQGTTAQIYTRDQSMMGPASNQPVQLVAFLPATPMLSNTNHTQPAPAAPPPPPPPPTYPTTVISYPQASPPQQTQPSFNSETYSIPPVTLAPIHQAEMYQSRGGVTYYNTRSQVKPRSPPPPRVKTAIPIVPPPNEN